MGEPPGPPLTQSSELALDWAAHFASMRGASTIDSIDLLLGLVFAHPGDSEPGQLLDHFRIPGTMLAEALATMQTPAHHMAPTTRLPLDPPPRGDRLSMGNDVGQILDRAAKLMEQHNADERLIRVRDLFGAMLQATSTPAWSMLAGLLEARRVDVDIPILAKEYDDYLREGKARTYDEFLATHTPYSPRPLTLPRFDADAVLSDRRDRGRDPGVPDLIGITPEVDAFAHLLAAKDLQPPLAIGLFGDWGAGKTYFMRALQRRVYRITEAARSGGRPQSTVPIYKSVAQIEFNAWHYVEGNLWASLVEHIFRNLQTREDDLQADLDDRRRELAAKVLSTKATEQQVQEEIRWLESRRDEARDKVAAIETRRDTTLSEAGSMGAVTRGVLAAASTNQKVQKAMASLGLEQEWTSVGQFRAALTDARDTAQRGFGIITQLRARNPVLVTIGVVTVVGVPILSLVLANVDTPAITNAIASGAAALTGATALLVRSTDWTRARLKELETVETVVGQAERADELERNALTEELAGIDRELAVARERAVQLDQQVDDLKASIAQLTPGQLLIQYIDQRAASDDYRKHLGVPAIIRRDFEELSRRLEEENRSFIDTDDGEQQPNRHAVNRIILYIDDLDRCPPPVVVKVLQAVHLLLAFPLFVVVVAVDSRWLANSLEQHYAHLLSARSAIASGIGADGTDGRAIGEEQATPDDYLEKIFQIPFWIRPLTEGARRQIVEGLIAPSLIQESSAAGPSPIDGGGKRTAMDEATLRALTNRLFGRDGGDAGLDPATLGIFRHELEFMNALSPILGESPREVKRFVNVYRLMKALEEPRSATGFTAARPFAEHQLVMFLLAVVTGLPTISARVWTGIKDPPIGVTTLLPLARLIEEGAAPGDDLKEARALVRWLDGPAIMGGHWGTLQLATIAPWLEPIARFTFGSETATEPLPAGPTGARPARRRSRGAATEALTT